MVSGLEEGPFTVYNPDGSVAREGRYEAGFFEGLVRAFAPRARGGEPLRACCVPPTAVRLDVHYRAGEFLSEAFYDGEGREIRSDGSPCPPRPSGLPEIAMFEEAREGWALHVRGLDRYWDVDGRLVEESEATPERLRAVRSFDEAGEVLQEQHFDEPNRRHGPFRRRFPSGAPGSYADARIREERGAFTLGQPTGRWTFLDEAGGVVRVVDRGVGFDPAELAASPAFADGLADGWAVARELAAARRIRESLCAAARAAARDGDRPRLEAWLAAHVVALAPAVQVQTGEALTESTDATAPIILDGLVGGTDPAAAFRALAAVLPGSGDAALELVEASLLLAPERRRTHLTRALVRVEHGDDAGARADAEVVAGEAPDAAESLRRYVGLLFRPFAPFPPSTEEPSPDPELGDATLGIGQSLEAIRRMVGVYATRLGRLRDRLRSMGIPDDVAWLPPDLTALLPNGPVELRRERITCDLDESAPPGSEPDVIEIDEAFGLEERGAPALVAAARSDYGALAWLCWAVGLDRVALPTSIAPAERLTEAMQMIVKRHWRAQDRLKTGGLLALTKGVPGFDWEGMEIDVVPSHVTWMVVAEYLAPRSMFVWLASPDALTPFEDDIRDA
jgi:hypothetical protein